MDDLLQRLWNQFISICDGIDEAMNDDDPWSILDEYHSDNEELKKLRQDLFNAGVKNIPGFKYE